MGLWLVAIMLRDLTYIYVIIDSESEKIEMMEEKTQSLNYKHC